MERLDTYCPELSSAERRSLEVAIEPGKEPRSLDLLEFFPDEECGPTKRCRIELLDTDAQFARAIVDIDLQAGDVRRAPESPSGLESELLCAVVTGLARSTDWLEELRGHGEAFARARDAEGRDEGPSPEAFEEAGRNDRCPCGSGQKFKRCCLGRRANEGSKANEVASAQKTAEAGDGSVSMEGINFLLQAFWSVLAADKPQRQALRLLDDVGIEVDRKDVVEAAGDADSVEDFPASWRRDFDPNWTWQQPVLEVVLPVVAEVLWQHWAPETPRPHSIKRGIVAGRRHVDEPRRAFEDWSVAWSELSDWLECRSDVEGKPLVEWLDGALRHDDGIDDWVARLLDVTREIVDDEEPTALAVLEEVNEVFAASRPGLANDAAVFRYAALIDAGDDAAARQMLKRLQSQPLADHHAALYLCDLVVKWDYRPPSPHLSLIVEIAERAMNECCDDAGVEVEEARDQLLIIAKASG